MDLIITKVWYKNLRDIPKKIVSIDCNMIASTEFSSTK